MLPVLSAADLDALADLEKRLAVVRDRVTAVCTGHQTGFYLCGAGGLGKSYTVLKQLDDQGADYRTYNSRITARGLFDALCRDPQAIHLIEDVERITSDRDAQSLLRAALWAQPGRERVVTWTTATGGRQVVTFQGGLILLANRPLADLPELRALATRITVYRLEATDVQLAALMRKIAADGFDRDRRRVEADKALEVAEFLIAESKKVGCPLDLRLFDNSCLDYLQWEAAQSGCHWQDLVASRVRECATHFRHEVSMATREQRLDLDRGIVRDICLETADAEERVKLWKVRTGKGQATFYRRKRELDSGEFPDE
jgi:hypothetical protein